ncbi:hypothetical protein MSAN_00081600 [Mycena sanguinolenta]|uniref:Uncharacterized protein n=1 Tax=Mycena sanguinolenta TaxID=230812 RepID=A0A8H7DLE6_9AGAR|nr:hypothetical protein MSAN_00081600 [Mycena sanguinolenta]
MSVEVVQPRSSTRSSPNVPPIDLRHMTSATVLALDNRRASQHLQATVRKGSKSPSSIPSSPTSVHSSSSAIFERDIEPIHVSPIAPPGAKKDPHRIARSKNTEPLDQSVPSVLDSAASILTSMTSEEGDSISVIAPAPLCSTGLLDQSTPALSHPRNPSLHSPPPLPFRPPPSSAPPTARQFDPATPLSSVGDNAFNAGTTRAASSTSQANKRLSFVSYTDLLSSTPTATQPLSALTSPAASPAHIPGVSITDPTVGVGSASAYGGSGAPSLRNFGFGLGDEDRMMDDVGGEWEREGLGKGLEERLEALQGFGMS